MLPLFSTLKLPSECIQACETVPLGSEDYGWLQHQNLSSKLIKGRKVVCVRYVTRDSRNCGSFSIDLIKRNLQKNPFLALHAVHQEMSPNLW